jgi:hypothetical protein
MPRSSIPSRHWPGIDAAPLACARLLRPSPRIGWLFGFRPSRTASRVNPSAQSPGSLQRAADLMVKGRPASPRCAARCSASCRPATLHCSIPSWQSPGSMHRAAHPLVGRGRLRQDVGHGGEAGWSMPIRSAANTQNLQQIAAWAFPNIAEKRSFRGVCCPNISSAGRWQEAAPKGSARNCLCYGFIWRN